MEVRNSGQMPGTLPEEWSQGLQQLAKNLAATGALGGLQSSEQVDELLALQQSLETSGKSATGGSSSAPAIGGVSISFSAEDLAAALLVLQGKTQESQLRTAKEGLETSRVKTEQSNEKALNKILEANEKAKEAASKSKAMGILGWIGKIAGFIAAIAAVAVAAVATVASGGAAAPLLAFAVIGLVGATISLASAVSQELGGPPLEISSLLNKAFTAMLEAFGMDKEDAEKFGRMIAGAVGVATLAVLVDPALAGDLFAGIALVAGADEMQAAIVATVFTVAATLAMAIATVVLTAGAGTGSAVANVASSASKISDGAIKMATAAGKITQAVGGLTQAATSITAGGIGIAKAHDERDIENLRADKKEIDALLMKLQMQMEEEREEIRKVMEQIMDGYNVVMNMFSDAAASRQQLTANIGGRGAVV